jgi:hypothetical protein
MMELVVPVLLGILALLAVLLGLAILVKYLARWAKGHEDELPPSAGLLSQFRILYERGECTQEEFDRVRAKLGKQLREELNVAAEPAAAKNPPAGDVGMRLPDPAVQPTIGPVTDSADPGSNPSTSSG